MRTDHAIFMAFIFAFVITILASFWLNKFSRGAGCLGYILILILALIASLLLFLYATTQVLTACLIALVALVFLTIIIMLISR